MRFINLTPHAIVLNDGTRYEPSGNVARVKAEYTSFDSLGICSQTFGPIEGLPECPPGFKMNDDTSVYIVSALVLAALRAQEDQDEKDTARITWRRLDVVAPATGHPNCIRHTDGPQKGQIISVPGFVR